MQKKPPVELSLSKDSLKSQEKKQQKKNNNKKQKKTSKNKKNKKNNIVIACEPLKANLADEKPNYSFPSYPPLPPPHKPIKMIGFDIRCKIFSWEDNLLEMLKPIF